jgi:creatinine amidohydrolase
MELNMKPILWDELTGPEIKELYQKMNMVILPVGATEQHGAHLPLCTDSLIPTKIAHAISAETGVPVLPTIMYGDSQTHKTLGSTIWLRPETLHHWIYDVCKSLYFQGFKRILVINGHGTNVWPLHTAWSNLRFDFPDIQMKIADDTIYRFLSDKDEKKRVDLRKLDPYEYHAGTTETSLVLALRPDLVKMELAEDWPMKMPHGALFDYRVDQITKTGVCGRPTKASKEIGEEMFDIIVRTYVKWVKAALEEKIPFIETGEVS